MRLSRVARDLKPSATLSAAARAAELKRSGIRVYDFGLGEPDFATPEHICEAARKAIAAGHTHYTPAAGIPELKEAVARTYREKAGLPYQANQVVVSNGAKHTIHNVLTALVGPGDEVLIPSPYWVSYSEMVQITGARAVVLPTREEDGFKLRPEQLRAAMGPNSRLLMINSPCNPTGAVYSPEQLEALSDVVLKSDLAVLSDEIYERLIFGSARQRSFAALRPGLVERTITVSGVSKSYAMTGWRIGWAAGPRDLMRAVGDIQSQETSNPCSISQHAALAALEGDQSCVEQMRLEFARRRDFVLHRLREIPGLSCVEPEGAFYVFINISRHLGRNLGGVAVSDSAKFCEVCLDQAHVGLVAGSAFGAEGYVRLSFAASMANLEAGLDRLARLLTG